ncbi:MAG: site-specific DNA-methyltransferase [bacterium]
MNKKNGTQTSSFGTSGRINHDSTKFYNSKLYSEIDLVESKNKCENTIDIGNANVIYNTSSEKMYQLKDNSIHLMITSPPYNVTKEYDKDLSLKEYLTFLRTVFIETYRVLIDGGRACINVANLGRRPYIPLSDYISQMMNEIGFNMRGEIIWNKAASASPSTAWGSWLSAANPILRDVHEYILVFSKGKLKRDSFKKENSITKEQFMEWTKSIWTMNAESAKRVGHPAPFPEELPKRLIHLYSFKGDIVLDPFIGSGTTALAAVKAERKYIGYETDLKYIELANSRLDSFLKQGELFAKTT